MVNVNLMKGDCLELMKSIPDASVDMILTDPPYGTTQNKWDSVVDLESMWCEIKRIIKPNGAIVLFGAQPFSSVLVSSNIKDFKYDWTWRKPKGTGHLNAKKQPMRDKEDILVFYQKQCTYNPQMSEGTPYKDKAGKNHSGNDSMSENYGAYTNFRNDNKGTRYPKQVLEFGVVERGSLHPTQKPVALLEYLIKTYTQDGETVLDFTAGSMSTAIACINTNRKGIMIEKDEHYFKVGSDRVAQALQELGNDNI